MMSCCDLFCGLHKEELHNSVAVGETSGTGLEGYAAGINWIGRKYKCSAELLQNDHYVFTRYNYANRTTGGPLAL
jgi:hypothetical protein